MKIPFKLLASAAVVAVGVSLTAFAALLIQHVYFYRLELPNGYFVQELWGADTILEDQHGSRMLNHKIGEFSVEGAYVIGWIVPGEDRYFVLNTATGELQTFESSETLDRYLASNNVEGLWMHDQSTLLSYKTGLKQPTWKR